MERWGAKMSTTGLVTLHRKTVLLSDGIAARVDGIDPDNFEGISDDRIVYRDHKKIGKLSRSVGFIWTGAFAELAGQFETRCTATHPREAAKQLRDALVPASAPYLKEKWFCPNVSIVGYTSKGLEYHQVVKYQGSIIKRGGSIIPEITILADVPFRDQAETHAAFEEICKQTAIEKFDRTLSVEAVIEAWSQFVEHYNRPGFPLGGQLFHEIIEA